MALHVGLGRGTAMDAGVGVNEGQVLTLRVGEPCRGHRHTIDSSAPLVTERHDDHTLSSRPERSRALRAPDPAPRWPACGPHAQASSDPARGRLPGCRTRPLPRALAWAARPSTGPSAASWWRVISTRPCTRSPAPGPP